MSPSEAYWLKLIAGEDHIRPNNPSHDDLNALNQLCARGYAEQVMILPDHNMNRAFNAYSVTDAGRLALQEYDEYIRQLAENQAKNEREKAELKAKMLKQNVFNFVSTIIGTLIAGVLLQLVLSLFH